MGSSLSPAQEEVLINTFKSALLMMDGDEAGRSATTDCLSRLGRRIWVKAILLPGGQQPDALRSNMISQLLQD